MGTDNQLANIGRHFLIGLRPHSSLGAEDRRLLQVLKPAGVVVFANNFARESSYDELVAGFAELLKDVRDAIGRRDVAVAIDHEGGRVFRLPSPFTNPGSPRQWAGLADEVGKVFGVELRSLAVNLNFAPVLDIDTNPRSPVIGDRALGGSAIQVAEAAQVFARAQMGSGVLCCGKHFPGHGDTDIDSHYGLPVVQLERSTIIQRELYPFIHASGFGIPMIMSGHLLVPSIDAHRPTTRSLIVGKLLREEVGFRGVYITDDLGMHAVQPLLDDPEFAIDVAHAGHDMFMMCAAWTATDRMMDFAVHLLRGLQTGRIDAAQWNRSRARIDELIPRLHHGMPQRLSEDAFASHRALKRRILEEVQSQR